MQLTKDGYYQVQDTPKLLTKDDCVYQSEIRSRHMSSFTQSYLLNIAVSIGMLAGTALVYVLLLRGLGWLLSRWKKTPISRTLWLSIVTSLAVAVIAVPLFQGIAGLYRYDPLGGNLSGIGRERGDWQSYVLISQIAFLALYGFLVVFGGGIGFARARHTPRVAKEVIDTVVAISLYLLAILPFVDFVNACVLGKPFLLPASC